MKHNYVLIDYENVQPAVADALAVNGGQEPHLFGGEMSLLHRGDEVAG